jgi:amidophosphoribosyltransferase
MCGLIGLSGRGPLVSQLATGMFHLQHRGQQGFGLAMYDPSSHQLTSVKRCESWGEQNESTLLEPFYKKEELRSWGEINHLIVGHTRYPTFGEQTTHELQPFLSTFPHAFALMHNGNLLNYQECALKFKSVFVRQSSSDSELLFFLLQYFLSQENENDSPWIRLQQAVKMLMKEVKGSYACVGFWGPIGLFAFRDPHGIRPLVYGKHPEGEQGFCSESGPLEYLGYQSFHSFLPGELMVIEHNGLLKKSLLEVKTFRPCFFEWVYFSGPGSTIDEHSVYQTRIQLGYALGEKIFHEQWLQKWGVYPDLVAGVPDTGRTAAWSLSLALQLPFREVFFRQRSSIRSFIKPVQSDREDVVRSKFIPIRKEIEGKSILLVDDSIVRGTTSRSLVRLLRQFGAKQIILVSTSPPIRYPCFLGIDFPERAELISHHYDPESLATFLGAQGVLFLDVKRLLNIFHFQSSARPCLGCVEGDYPYDLTETQIDAFSLQRHGPSHLNLN